MIISTTRTITAGEKNVQVKKFPGIYQRFEGFVLKLMVIVMILLVPMLIYDHYNPVASNMQAIYCIVILILSVFIVNWLTNKYRGGFYNRQKEQEDETVVEVVSVKTNRAIRREDPEDYGVAYYIDVVENGQRKVLYLWGQYLDELEFEGLFPNTEFEFVRRSGSDEFLSFKTAGQPFRQEKTLPPFGKDVWKSGIYPVNGQLLDLSIDEIM
ncbi:MAG: hypothetical protein QM731_06690 [Chitinophagaceae bacterium]